MAMRGIHLLVSPMVCNGGDSCTLTANRLGSDLGHPASCTIGVTGGSAVEGVDFESLGNPTFEWNVGDGGNQTVPFTTKSNPGGGSPAVTFGVIAHTGPNDPAPPCTPLLVINQPA